MTDPVSDSQQTQNVADGLRIAWERYDEHVVTDGRCEIAALSILRASVSLACKRLMELQQRADANAADAADAERWRKFVASSPSGEICYRGRTYTGKAAIDAAVDGEDDDD